MSKIIRNVHAAVVQLLSHVQLFATPQTAAYQASLSFTVSQRLLKLNDATQLLSFVAPSPPAPNLSQHDGLFQ